MSTTRLSRTSKLIDLIVSTNSFDDAKEYREMLTEIKSREIDGQGWVEERMQYRRRSNLRFRLIRISFQASQLYFWGKIAQSSSTTISWLFHVSKSQLLLYFLSPPYLCSVSFYFHYTGYHHKGEAAKRQEDLVHLISTTHSLRPYWKRQWWKIYLTISRSYITSPNYILYVSIGQKRQLQNISAERGVIHETGIVCPGQTFLNHELKAFGTPSIVCCIMNNTLSGGKKRCKVEGKKGNCAWHPPTWMHTVSRTYGSDVQMKSIM